ncbi:Protein of unknown function [Escherichia coli D6-117.29]|nr:Protein of unknown function [Escherichia coli D6-113.11]CDP72096.1 Protein of unknown function [Escherichia coli]CDP75518.1 Protein of unknown function [Escherichia coli D6-117.29]CDU35449.1 Protein of unknown function [Escherichia coli D6-113.11]CDU39287.1 Protein of unknown function [Escherichia coli]
MQVTPEQIFRQRIIH